MVQVKTHSWLRCTNTSIDLQDTWEEQLFLTTTTTMKRRVCHSPEFVRSSSKTSQQTKSITFGKSHVSRSLHLSNLPIFAFPTSHLIFPILLLTLPHPTTRFFVLNIEDDDNVRIPWKAYFGWIDQVIYMCDASRFSVDSDQVKLDLKRFKKLMDSGFFSDFFNPDVNVPMMVCFNKVDLQKSKYKDSQLPLFLSACFSHHNLHLFLTHLAL
jgi:hypothetical protein